MPESRLQGKPFVVVEWGPVARRKRERIGSWGR
jgi:hypothetical protein